MVTGEGETTVTGGETPVSVLQRGKLCAASWVAAVSLSTFAQELYPRGSSPLVARDRYRPPNWFEMLGELKKVKRVVFVVARVCDPA